MWPASEYPVASTVSVRPLWPAPGIAASSRACDSSVEICDEFALRSALSEASDGRLFPPSRLERSDGRGSRSFGLPRPGLVGRQALSEDGQVGPCRLRGADHLTVEAARSGAGCRSC